MVNLLVDTSVLVDILRRSKRTVDWLAGQPASTLYLSAITVGELYCGLYQMHAGDPGRLAPAVLRLQDDTLKPFAGRIIAFDMTAAQIWGRIMGEGAARGATPPTTTPRSRPWHCSTAWPSPQRTSGTSSPLSRRSIPAPHEP